MKILIVSGFLGAGKTTFIKALARCTGKKFAVLENEYGAAGIDGDRLNQSMKNGEVNLWEMTDGCICCSAKGDFATSVLTIANAVDPEYLVVEPTGVGMLGHIVENLQQIEYERISLLAPVTIVDIHSYQRYQREYPELYLNQIREAGTIIVSKTEESAESEKDALKRFLRKENPNAVIVTQHYTSMSNEMWEQLLLTKYDGTVICTEDEASQKMPESFSVNNVVTSSVERIIFFLEDLIRGKYGDVIRAKGQMYAGKIPIQFDVADGRYCITGIDGITTGKAVFIGKELKRQKIRRYFITKNKMRI